MLSKDVTWKEVVTATSGILIILRLRVAVITTFHIIKPKILYQRCNMKTIHMYGCMEQCIVARLEIWLLIGYCYVTAR